MLMRTSVKWLSKIARTIGAIATFTISGATNVRAAETVVVRFGLLSESIAVADLRTIAETGTIPDSLRNYAKRLSSEQRQQVIGALRTKIPLNFVAVSKLLNTRMGTTILSDIATVTPREDTAGAVALRSALVLGAKSPEGLSIINFIEAYPSQRLNIDLKQAFKVMQNLNASFWQTQQFMSAIAPQLVPQDYPLKLPFDPSQSGSATVEIRNLTLKDSQRSRTIPVDIYWSTATTSAKPIVIFSHGLGSVRQDMDYIAKHLASHGYIVVAPEHPGSNATHVDRALAGGDIIKPQEFLERPKDLSFILDELEKLNKTTNPLQGKLATNNVMVIGYSMGGGTALSIAGGELQLAGLKQRCQNNLIPLSFGEGLQCIAGGLPEERYQLGDRRIKRAIAFNPTSALMFGDTGLTKVAVPTLIVAGSDDKTTPALAEQILAFTKLPSPKWLVGVIGGTHLSIKDPSTTMDQADKPNISLIGGEIVGDRAADIRQYIKAIVLAMAAQQTEEDAAQYAIFLTPEYAQYASTPSFPIRLVTELSDEAESVIKTFLDNQRR